MDSECWSDDDDLLSDCGGASDADPDGDDGRWIGAFDIIEELQLFCGDGDAAGLARALARGGGKAPVQGFAARLSRSKRASPMRRAAVSGGKHGAAAAANCVTLLLDAGFGVGVNEFSLCGGCLGDPRDELWEWCRTAFVSVLHYGAAAEGRLPVLLAALRHDKTTAAHVNGRGSTMLRGKASADKCTTPLFLAALTNRRGAVEALLADGRCDVELGDSTRGSPLAIASRIGCEDAVRALLRHGGTDVEAPIASGHTPLCFTILQGHTLITFLLLRHGASVKRRKLSARGLLTPCEYVAVKMTEPDWAEMHEVADVRTTLNALKFVRRVVDCGGIAEWCADQRHQLASLRALVSRGRAAMQSSGISPRSRRRLSSPSLSSPSSRADAIVQALFAHDRPFRENGLFRLVLDFWLAPTTQL
ncbi:hypothetical protein M885DRAFT_504626 [Pelagophyceae sp. CCMP2097]|nr:hypothetical protein M885DRAFT_504626 [Pelagophyceae sp. CCMP2097]|mmetsp:Transcript_12218/g.42301  ORF Transcript_12218/g.42301 Transcript_12218/m.42301 type:complete len:419 (-) Transcript_12218:42-1298(-)